MDPYTMEQATILAARQAETTVRHSDEVEQYPVIETHILHTGEIATVQVR